MKHTKRFSISPVSAAVALALGLAIPSAAFAAGMPGLGTVTVGNVASNTAKGTGVNNGGAAAAAGTYITGLTSGDTLTVTGNSVVQWGGVTAGVTDTNSAGFNLSSGNVLNVAGTKANLALLNVDASGGSSNISGKLLSTGTDAVNLFIANANGITVGTTGTIAAPYVALIGANLAVGNNTAGVPTAAAGSVQALFGSASTVPVSFANANGTISVQGAIVGSAASLPTVNPTSGLLIAGSGSVNVDFTNVQVSAANPGVGATVFGGSAFSFNNVGTPALNKGTQSAGVSGYVATNVALNNAPASLVEVDAVGNLTISGNSVLPSTVNWNGVLANTGSLQLTSNTIEGTTLQTIGTKTYNYLNSWYNVQNPSGGGFENGPVGSVVNSGTITSGGAGLTVNSNGFTNTGTLNLQAGTSNVLSIYSGAGDINLGGVVQTNQSQAAIKSATLNTTTSGNINVSAPLTIGNSGANNGASFTATASNGNVNIASAVAVTSTNTDDSIYNGATAALWSVSGNSVTISGAQTVKNSKGTNKLQPYAQVTLNQNGGAVNITSTGSLTAGDIFIGGAFASKSPTTPATTGRAALTLDGQLTATNTGYSNSTHGGDVGSININATYIQTSATANMTAQQFNFDYTRYANKYKDRSATGFVGNGVLITPVGSNPTLNLAETGSNPQNTNITAAGNITVNANSTTVNYQAGALLNGTASAGTAPGNSGSNVVLTSSGNLTLGASSSAAYTNTNGNNVYNGSGTYTSFQSKDLGGSANGSFWLPGSLYLANINSATAPTGLSSTGSITALSDVYNDYLLPVAGGKGIFFGTNNLTVNGSLFTNMKSLVNFTTAAQQAQYQGQVYQVQYSPSNISNTLNVVPNSGATKVYPFNNF